MQDIPLYLPTRKRLISGGAPLRIFSTFGVEIPSVCPHCGSKHTSFFVVIPVHPSLTHREDAFTPFHVDYFYDDNSRGTEIMDDAEYERQLKLYQKKTS